MHGHQATRRRIVLIDHGADTTSLAAWVKALGYEPVLHEPGFSGPGGDALGDAGVALLRVGAGSAGNAAEALGQLSGEAGLSVLVLVDHGTPALRAKLLEAGAADVVETAAADGELRVRLDRLCAAGEVVRDLRVRVDELEQRVGRQTVELEDARIQILERLARAAEYRDDDTGEHTRRVGALAGALAEGLGLPASQVERIRRAAPLHDVGKIGVPDGILLKPGRLTPKEVEVMQTHVTIGARMLSGTDITLLNTAATIALTHHEQWDGSGYPEGKRGADIPLVGRIVAVADVFDALTTRRPYKDAWSLDDTVAELEAERGRHMDPDVTDVMLRLVRTDALPEIVRTHVQEPNPEWRRR